MSASLSDRDRAILDFEGGRHWQYVGSKEAEIRHLFAVTATRYYQLLNALIDTPEALVYAPSTVNRLRRVRDARRRARPAMSR